VPRAGELTFLPEVDGVEFNPAQRTFRWRESVHREEFRLCAEQRLEGQMVRGRMTVFWGTIILAEVTLVFRVTNAALARPRSEAEVAHARPYRHIFASYSHQDLEIVEHVGKLATLLGDSYLRDWTHLRAGDVWDDRLKEMIDQADIFQLFWSRNAMHSDFVRREWEHALALGRPNFIRPTYWEEPFPQDPQRGLPPAALSRLHFQKLSVQLLPRRPEVPALRPEAAPCPRRHPRVPPPGAPPTPAGFAWEAWRRPRRWIPAVLAVVLAVMFPLFYTYIQFEPRPERGHDPPDLKPPQLTREQRNLSAHAAGTVGLLAAPLGQGPLLAGAALFPRPGEPASQPEPSRLP
jgi:hypothetical protein